MYCQVMFIFHQLPNDEAVTAWDFFLLMDATRIYGELKIIG